MTNAELIRAVRENEECNNCAIWKHGECNERKMSLAAADALEAAERLLDQNTKRCEALRKQLREAHENYEKHINELEAQLPKQDRGVCMTACGTLYVPNYYDER